MCIRDRDEAFASLKETGIIRWREGEALRQDLENQVQAQEVYQEGLALVDVYKRQMPPFQETLQTIPPSKSCALIRLSMPSRFLRTKFKF